ncbi:MAG: serine O-acetyltransferase [Clostridiales bacterium]|nr:serine O-acetyltransferase [Clostridiales bacterium]
MVTGKETTFKNAVDRIACNYACQKDMPIYCGEMKLPDRNEIVEILNEVEKILFPAYFGVNSLKGMTAEEFIEKTLISIYYQLKTQLELAFSLCKCTGVKNVFEPEELDKICDEFINELPSLQEMLLKDVTANFEGDPAASSKSEIVLSYPGFYAIFVYRIAHELYKRKVLFVPRMMTEYAHGKTGIDINPGAEIGEYFFIDHGTGIVIGETTNIGNNVKIYQGVTLGALSPRKGQSLSGVKRHPTVEDNVTIYSNTSVLGGDTVIGENSVLGGNLFITSSVEKNSYVSMKAPELIIRTDE